MVGLAMMVLAVMHVQIAEDAVATATDIMADINAHRKQLDEQYLAQTVKLHHEAQDQLHKLHGSKQ